MLWNDELHKPWGTFSCSSSTSTIVLLLDVPACVGRERGPECHFKLNKNLTHTFWQGTPEGPDLFKQSKACTQHMPRCINAGSKQVPTAAVTTSMSRAQENKCGVDQSTNNLMHAHKHVLLLPCNVEMVLILRPPRLRISLLRLLMWCPIPTQLTPQSYAVQHT